MVGGQHEGAGKAAVGGVGSEELLHLLDGGAAAKPRQPADQLDETEVAGGQRVHLTAAVQAQALDGPGPDLADRQQAPVAGRVGRVDRGPRPPRARPGSTPAPGPAPGPLPRARPGRGRRAARRLARREASRHRAPRPGTPAKHHSPLDPGRTRRLDQLLGDRPRERLPGPGTAPRPVPATAANRRPSSRSARNLS